jgi:hypothetical protein
MVDYFIVIKVTFCCVLFTFSYLIFLIRHLICNVFLRTTPNRYSFFLGKCFVAKILARGIFLRCDVPQESAPFGGERGDKISEIAKNSGGQEKQA